MRKLVLCGYFIFLFSCFTGAQNVGIGTNNPQAKLHISGKSATTSPLLFLTDSLGVNGSYQLSFTQQGFAPSWLVKANTNLGFYYNNLLRLNITNTGLAGLGVSTPQAGLHLSSDVGYIGHVSGGNNMYMAIAENGLNNGYFGSFSGNSEDVDFGTYSGNNQAQLHLVTQDQPRLTIDSTGEVLIGTTKSINQLTIGAGLQIDAAFKNGTLDGNGNTIQNWLRFGSFSGEAIASNNNIAAPDYRGLNFYTNSQPRLTITQNGRIGINTTNPQAELHVNGNIKTGRFAGISQSGAGVVTIGPHNADTLNYKLDLGERYSGGQYDNEFFNLMLTVEQTFQNVGDAFIAKLQHLDRTPVNNGLKAEILITRVGAGANGTGWGQTIKLHWLIIE
jgi:hypothetical protein